MTSEPPFFTSNGKRRKHSWPGEHHMLLRKESALPARAWRILIWREIRSLVLWMTIVPILHVLLEQRVCNYPKQDGQTNRNLFQSILSVCTMKVLPSKVLTRNAPGIIYSNVPLLLTVRSYCGSYPNLSCRACEWRLGRLHNSEIVVVVMIHMFAAILALYAPFLMSIEMDHVGVVQFDEAGTWWLDSAQELVYTCCFVVGLLVLPVLLELNYLSGWLAFFLLYPLYNASVDATGKGSTLSPVILIITGNYLMLGRFAAQILGGILAGEIMTVFFPDEDQ